MNRLLAALKWVVSPEGRKDVGAALALAGVIYDALHRASVL